MQKELESAGISYSKNEPGVRDELRVYWCPKRWGWSARIWQRRICTGRRVEKTVRKWGPRWHSLYCWAYSVLKILSSTFFLRYLWHCLGLCAINTTREPHSALSEQTFCRVVAYRYILTDCRSYSDLNSLIK